MGKQIKYTIEVKVLEAKEAEAAVLEAIKTVTDVELLNRKRWIASRTVGEYKKCKKFMVEYKMIYDKQTSVITSEMSDLARRIDVAQGAITSLKEKNEKDYVKHVTNCQKLKSKAKISCTAVNDSATTLKNQREYQVQITNLKDTLIKSHEQALSKRQEAEKVFTKYTTYITKFEQQLTVTQEQILESKTKISAAQEVIRILTIRIKEITVLMSRTTISTTEETKL